MSEGPICVCACGCGEAGRGFLHFSEGWILRKRVERASSITEIRWIGGKKFHRQLKGVAPSPEKVRQSA